MRARARALAGQHRPKCRGPPRGRLFFFFFPFERARARGTARWAFSYRARASAHARSLPSPRSRCGARGWGANRSVRRVFPQHPQGRYSGAPSRSTPSHRNSRISPDTRRTRPLSGVLSSQVLGMDGPSLEKAVTPSFPPAPRAGTPESVGTRVWWPLAGPGSSRALPFTGPSGPPPRGLPWRPCEAPFSH